MDRCFIIVSVGAEAKLIAIMNSINFIAIKIASFILIVVFISPYASLADPVNGRLVGDLYEELSEDVNASTGDIVGMWMGGFNEKLSLGQSQVVISADIKIPISVCFSATTLDGLYFARGALHATSNNTGALDIIPLRESPYLSVLSKYNTHEFAPLARLGSSCSASADAPIAPIRYLEDGRNLSIAINSRRSHSVSVQLQLDDNILLGVCSFLETRRVAYDVICSIELPDELKHGKYLLSVKRQPRVGPGRVDHTDVVL